MVLMLSPVVATTHAKAQTDIPESSVDHTIRGIQRAAEAGADVSSLIDKFNLGLDYLNQAQSSDFKICSSSEDCIIRANEIFVSIDRESSILIEQSEVASNYRSIMTYGLLVPMGAFSSSLTIAFFLKVWRSYRLKKFLDKEIRQN